MGGRPLHGAQPGWVGGWSYPTARRVAGCRAAAHVRHTMGWSVRWVGEAAVAAFECRHHPGGGTSSAACMHCICYLAVPQAGARRIGYFFQCFEAGSPWFRPSFVAAGGVVGGAAATAACGWRPQLGPVPRGKRAGVLWRAAVTWAPAGGRARPDKLLRGPWHAHSPLGLPRGRPLACTWRAGATGGGGEQSPAALQGSTVVPPPAPGLSPGEGGAAPGRVQGTGFGKAPHREELASL